MASPRPGVRAAATTDNSGIAFHEAYDLTPDRIAHVESVVQQRVLRYFRRHGLLDELDAAGVITWQGSGGFSVDASVRFEGEDRAGIERLVLDGFGPIGHPAHPPSPPPLRPRPREPSGRNAVREAPLQHG